MRCLITGATGFFGSHLTLALAQTTDWTLYGTSHKNPQRLTIPQEHIQLTQCDFRDQTAVDALVQNIQPDLIFHLAAQSLPADSWRNPRDTLDANVLGSINLNEAAKKQENSPRVVFVGSSAEYGSGTKEGALLVEDSPLEPVNPYGVSKLAADLMAQNYYAAGLLDIIRVRPFLIIGVGKTGDACSDFSRGVVAIEREQSSALRVGNLSSVRDFVAVQDASRALILIANHGESGEVYNLCSGIGHSMQEVLDLIVSNAEREIIIEQDAKRLRPTDELQLVGDSTKLQSLGWKPEVSLETALVEILEYWRRN